MNAGILASVYAAPQMPYGLLGLPQPIQMPGDQLAYVDEDAVSYISRVQYADRMPLESGVKRAIYDFIVGCKQDGTWSAIRASCILMGARTLAGALVPLVGAAPRPFNYVSADYNRKTGLIGNGSNKYLNSNRPGNADPLNSKHASVFVTSANTAAPYAYYFGAGYPNDAMAYHTSNGALTVGVNAPSPANSSASWTPAALVGGLVGVSRGSSSTITARGASQTVSVAQNSSASSRTATNQFVNAQSGGIQSTNARLAFYSFGEAISLSLLDSRVSALYAAIGSAIR